MDDTSSAMGAVGGSVCVWGGGVYLHYVEEIQS